jgi:hypothetical protein
MGFLGFTAHAGGQKTILQFKQQLLVGRDISLVHSLTRQLDSVGLSRPQGMIMSFPALAAKPKQTGLIFLIRQMLFEPATASLRHVTGLSLR